MGNLSLSGVNELKKVLKKTQKEKRAVGQFNFCTLEQLRAILSAAEKRKSPVILGLSEGELSYLGINETIALVEIARNKRKVSAFLNLDHGKDLDLIKKVIDYGFSAVHFDGSELPLEKNIGYAKKIVAYAKKKNVLVEGEVDSIEKGKFTSLSEAERFVKITGVDSLAVALGNVHGYDRSVKIDLKRLADFSRNIDRFLVLHGGSGIPADQIKKAIGLGIVKINVNTELRMAWKKGFIKELKSEELKPYKIVPKVQSVVQEKVEEKIELFNSVSGRI